MIYFSVLDLLTHHEINMVYNCPYCPSTEAIQAHFLNAEFEFEFKVEDSSSTAQTDCVNIGTHIVTGAIWSK